MPALVTTRTALSGKTTTLRPARLVPARTQPDGRRRHPRQPESPRPRRPRRRSHAHETVAAPSRPRAGRRTSPPEPVPLRLRRPRRPESSRRPCPGDGQSANVHGSPPRRSHPFVTEPLQDVQLTDGRTLSFPRGPPRKTPARPHRARSRSSTSGPATAEAAKARGQLARKHGPKAAKKLMRSSARRGR